MQRFQRLAVLAVAIVAGFANPVFAESSPEAVAMAYVNAMKTDVAAAADYIHPDELQRFKGMLSPLLADAKSPDARGFAQTVFGRQATVESVAALDPLSFMRGFMDFIDRHLKSVNVKFDDLQILGSVREGETVHLVTRQSAGAGGVQMTALAVMSLKPSGDTWKLLLPGQIEGLAQALKAQGTAGR